MVASCLKLVNVVLIIMCMLKLTIYFLQTVDRLIWYLRIVHSVDFFNGVVFPAEDHMPHRLGIITARAAKPLSLSVDQGKVDRV